MPPYSLPDWNALLAGIVAHPDADLPRLVAADWLEEHGDAERAAFIRLQCEREFDTSLELKWAEERYYSSPTGVPLWAAEACPNLVGPDFAAGSSLFAPYVGVEKVTFRRGFPHRVTCTADEWRRFGSLVVPRQPVCELVLRECRETDLAWWEMLPTLRYLRTVSLDDGDYRLLTFLRRELPTVDVLRFSATALAPAAALTPLPTAPPPRPVPAATPPTSAPPTADPTT